MSAIAKYYEAQSRLRICQERAGQFSRLVLERSSVGNKRIEILVKGNEPSSCGVALPDIAIPEIRDAIVEIVTSEAFAEQVKENAILAARMRVGSLRQAVLEEMK